MPAKNLAQRAEVRRLIEEHSPREIAARLGISRQRVYQILGEEDVDYLTLNQENRQRRRTLRRSLSQDHLDRHTRGAVSELFVATDLVQLGWWPYVPLIRNHGYDIIASRNGSLLTIEVRTARKRGDGSIVTNRVKGITPAQHFAFVIQDEPVLYEPELPPPPPPAPAATKRASSGRPFVYTDDQICRAMWHIEHDGWTWAFAAAYVKTSPKAGGKAISVPNLQKRVRELKAKGIEGMQDDEQAAD